MEDPAIEIPLPFSVEQRLQNICVQRLLPPVSMKARKSLSMAGELAALEILKKIATTPTPIKTLDGFIIFMVKNFEQESFDCLSPLNHCFSSSGTPQSTQKTSYDSPIQKQSIYSPCSSSNGETPAASIQHLSGPPTPTRSETTSISMIPPNRLVLAKLEFRKSFLIQSYIGRKKLEDVMSDQDAVDILRVKNEPMSHFEEIIWDKFGCRYSQESDRVKYFDWDSGKAHQYHCFICQNGDYYFKGPYLSKKRTHLQRTVGDENILIIKFEAAMDVSNMATYEEILEAGVLVGLRRYRFFVFKDGGKEEKMNRKENKKKTPNLWGKCYFIRTESLVPWGEREPYIFSQRKIHDARCLFMHVHTVSSMAKYIARFSLILSQTIKLHVDLASVTIEEIEDIPCRDENGCEVCDEDGQTLIHTDGTGFISEDLAMLCPKGFTDAKNIKEENFEENVLGLGGREACISEPPLLIQCRLFTKGCAVKGTLLVSKKLKSRTIQIRPSMVKVKKDEGLSETESFNSLEIVAISRKPRKANLSKNLIALLSIGGVPKEYFLRLVESTLDDAQTVFSNRGAAIRVALNSGESDDYFTCTQMIFSGIPLDEPCLQHRLSQMAIGQRKGLAAGRLPISDSFYLMGTADPTGLLNSDEVCVILDNGQLSGKVLVYRNPGLHFGDIHVLNAVYVKTMEDFVGNAKYAIFFSTKGKRSVASEIANGDFDGDMYWVSRNPQLLNNYKANKPWKRIYSTPNPSTRNPRDFSPEELEHELFKLLLDTRNQSHIAGIAADSWLAFMDRFLVLGDDDSDKQLIKEKMLKLIDIYYDALDASKSGKKVELPGDLKAEHSPHYLEKSNSYHSSSIIGQIYDKVQAIQSEKLSVKEIRKLPCFDIKVTDASLNSWKARYDTYRGEMKNALCSGEEVKNSSANSVIMKYKQLLYGAEEFEESTRNLEDIYDEARAIYHVSYDYARSGRGVEKCSFAWKVAGSALCKFYHNKQGGGERSIPCSPSILRDIYC